MVFNATVRFEQTPRLATAEIERSVDIDWGMKAFAATSEARVIRFDRHYRKLEAELGKAQRARKKARLGALHAKIKSSRKDQLYTFPRCS